MGVQNMDGTDYSGPSVAGGGPPPHDPNMEPRIAKVEASLEYVHETLRDIKSDVREIKLHARTDFRVIFAALIAVAIGLASLMAHGFKWI